VVVVLSEEAVGLEDYGKGGVVGIGKDLRHLSFRWPLSSKICLLDSRLYLRQVFDDGIYISY
jgi:hypothetical protein